MMQMLSTKMEYKQSLDMLTKADIENALARQQLATGKRFLTPSGDPIAAAQSLNTSSTLSLNEIYKENRGVATQNLNFEENTLSTITTLMQEVTSRIIEAGDGTYADSDRQALAVVIKSLRDSLLNNFNATDGNGKYLFSGYEGYKKPFDENGLYVIPDANSHSRLIQVDQNRQISTSDIGKAIFNQAAPTMKGYVIEAGANSGSAAFENLVTTSGQVNSNIPSFDIRINVVSGDPTLTPPTPNQYTYTYTPLGGSPVTLPVTPVQAPVGQPINMLIDLSGVSFSIKGIPEDGDTFSVTSIQNTDVSIIPTLDKLIDTLKRPAQNNESAMTDLFNTLATTNKKISAAYENILLTRSSVGARINELEALNAKGEQQKLVYTDRLDKLENISIEEAVSKVALRQAMLEAAGRAFTAMRMVNSIFEDSLRR